MKLSKETLENIKKSEEDIKAGRVKTLQEFEESLNMSKALYIKNE